MSEDVIEKAIAANFPVIAAPQSGSIEVPKQFGTRYIVAKQSLLCEIHTPWLYFRAPVARLAQVNQTPYGEVGLHILVQFKCNPLPMQVWKEFIAQARNDCPNEAAALAVWNHTTGAWRLAARQATLVTPGRIDYVEPEIGEDELVVVDMHSHGAGAAYFSSRDDVDDFGGIKIAVVWGKVQNTMPDIAVRLVCPGFFIPLRMNENGWFEITEADS